VYYYFVHKIWGSGSLLTHTHTLSLSLSLSLSKYVKKICVLCGRGGKARGVERGGSWHAKA
jgi:hypothetical protein